MDRGWGKAPIQIDLNVRQKFDDFWREVALIFFGHFDCHINVTKTAHTEFF